MQFDMQFWDLVEKSQKVHFDNFCSFEIFYVFNFKYVWIIFLGQFSTTWIIFCSRGHPFLHLLYLINPNHSYIYSVWYPFLTYFYILFFFISSFYYTFIYLINPPSCIPYPPLHLHPPYITYKSIYKNLFLYINI